MTYLRPNALSLTVGQSAIVATCHTNVREGSTYTSEAVTVTKVTHTQVTASNGERYMRMTGAQVAAYGNPSPTIMAADFPGAAAVAHYSATENASRAAQHAAEVLARSAKHFAGAAWFHAEGTQRDYRQALVAAVDALDALEAAHQAQGL